MRKTTRITLAITVICMALAGCGSASEPSTPAHESGPSNRSAPRTKTETFVNASSP